jgi:hypothetical protein
VPVLFCRDVYIAANQKKASFKGSHNIRFFLAFRLTFQQVQKKATEVTFLIIKTYVLIKRLLMQQHQHQLYVRLHGSRNVNLRPSRLVRLAQQPS